MENDCMSQSYFHLIDSTSNLSPSPHVYIKIWHPDKLLTLMMTMMMMF